MIDVHCHLNFHSFEQTYDEVIHSALEQGVMHIINTGTSIESSEKAIELAGKYDNLSAIVGIHPHHADTVERGWEKTLEHLAKQPKVIGIGEIGMDYYSYKSNGIVAPKKQEQIFRKQIELAIRRKLPIQIHNRHAGEDVLKILSDYNNELLTPPGMFHCFAGTKDVLKKALKLGYYIGFDGNITYKGIAPGESVELSELVRLTPIDRILTETDSPFLPPVPYRGKTNKPEYVVAVGKFLAELKHISFEEIDSITTQNAHTLFPALRGTI